MTIQNDDRAHDFAAWRKSSFSNPNGNECVEVAIGEGVVGVRDSKNPGDSLLAFAAGSWRQFTVRLD